MIRNFQNTSIRHKQILIIMLITSVALLLACATFVSFETVHFRRDMVQNLSTLAKIIGNNTAAALDFNDAPSAVETLYALKAQPNLIGACVYDKSRNIFAKYDRAGDHITFSPPPQPQASGHSFGQDRLALLEPITSKGDIIGAIYLESDMHGLHSKLAQFGLITAAVFLLTLLVAFLLSAQLQRLISEPILDLVRTTRAVARDKNYSLRVVKRSTDEIGVLMDDFNEMLAQIQQRETALQSARDELEVRVTERTAELATSNQALLTENAERRKVVEALRLLGSAVEQSKESIIITDAQLEFPGPKIIFVNPAFTTMTGYAAGEAIGQTPRLLQGPRTDQTVLSRLRWNLQRGEVFQGETVNYRKDGGEFNLEWQIAPIRDAGGKITHFVAIQRDITARKEVENALRESEAKFHQLSDNISDVFWITSPDLKAMHYVSAGYERIWGRSMESLVANPHQWIEVILPEDRDRVVEVFTTLMANAPAVSVEYRIARPDGSTRWVHDRGFQVRDAAGNLVRLTGIASDITERKQAEAARDRLAAILESTPDMVGTADPSGRCTYFNRAARNVLGLDAEEDVSAMLISEFHPAEEALAREGVSVAMRQGAWSGETILLTRQGRKIPVSQVIVAHKNADGKLEFISTIIRDISERKRFEAQLFQSQRMETVGKLAGGIAHEFNSILTAILGQSELLLGDLPAGSPLAKNATEIIRAASRAAALTRQLLAYGRKQILRPETLDLNQVLASMHGMFHHLMGGDVGTHMVPGAGLQAVHVDAGQIEQVIINMAMNARDAMPNGGKLTLETANVSIDQESVGRYPDLRVGDYVMLAITDTGTGMSEDVKARVFEPFFSTKEVGQGTGLGLSTCYGIVKQSGGHISVYSEQGRGATFKIYLPQVLQEKKLPIPRLNSPDLPRGTETILLVEDDPALREMAGTLLKRLGYTVLAAANGIEALSLKQQRGTGHIDLLFTDVVMPHMSGKELADRVQVLYPHTRILFTSAYTENAIVHQGVLNKGVALLQKPFTPSALAHKLREVLDQPGAAQVEAASNIPNATLLQAELNSQ